MTCIAAIIHNGKTYIGGDSAASVDDKIEVRLNRKVFRNGPYVIGFTGSFRTGQLLQFAKLPAIKGDVLAHLITAVVPVIKDISGKDVDELLIGAAGRLFKVSSDYSVAEYADYAAAGTGELVALGSLHGSLGQPDVRIIAALRAAQVHCPSVRAPFHLEVI